VKYEERSMENHTS